MLRYISQLEQHVAKLEKEYDVLTDTMAKGENSKYDAASGTQKKHV